jgi:hypothetical protein
VTAERTTDRGDLLRLPGAAVDYDHLDAFTWTPELVADYAARVRVQARRYGGRTVRGQLPTWSPGRC